MTTGELTVTSLSKEPKLEGKLMLAEFSPRALLVAMRLPVPLTASDEALTSLQAKLSFTGSPNGVNVQNLAVKFDQSALKGHLNIQNLEQLRLSFNLQLDELNRDTYLADSEPVESGERDPKTDFSELSISGVFQQGVLTSDDLLLLSPLLRVTGKGQLNLVDETIDYLVKPTIVGSLEGQGRQGLDALSGIPIPIKLTGNLYEPDIGIDIMAAVTATQKAKIDEEKDKLFNKLLGQESNDNGDGNADNAEQTAATESDSTKKMTIRLRLYSKGFWAVKRVKSSRRMTLMMEVVNSSRRCVPVS